MAEDWTTGYLCKGCGRSLHYGRPDLWGADPTATSRGVLESGQDEEGEFIRCLHCAGQHYFALDANRVMHFRYFKAVHRPLYGLRRRLGFARPPRNYPAAAVQPSVPVQPPPPARDAQPPLPKSHLSISRNDLSGHVASYREGVCEACGDQRENHTSLD